MSLNCLVKIADYGYPSIQQGIRTDICTTKPKKGKWWEDYTYFIFWNTNFGNTDNIEHIATYLHSARTVAVANLRTAKNRE